MLLADMLIHLCIIIGLGVSDIFNSSLIMFSVGTKDELRVRAN